MPKLAHRTPFTLVVDSFLMRAADYSVGHHHRQHAMLLHKFQNLLGDTWVGADIAMIYFPVAQFSYFPILGRHDADHDLCGLAQVGPIERNGRSWPTAQSFSGLLA